MKQSILYYDKQNNIPYLSTWMMLHYMEKGLHRSEWDQFNYKSPYKSKNVAGQSENKM